MKVKIKHQMEVLNPIYNAPDMRAFTEMAVLNIYFALPKET